MRAAAAPSRQATATAGIAGAIEAHARGTGLLREEDQLAEAHPHLAGFADPRYCPHVAENLDQIDYVESWTGFLSQVGTDGTSTRYLAEHYQHDSEQARKHRALVQTPRFVSLLMLHCSWANALHELARPPYCRDPLPLRAIDPACGGGHLVLDLFHEALIASGGQTREDVVRDALAVVHGVDLDPFAVMVTRYRLLAAACGWLRCRLDQAPHDLPVQVAAANSLLYSGALDLTPAGGPHCDANQHPRILESGRYDVVIANPPYVTVKDPVAREAIRGAYSDVCRGQYALTVPFEVLMHRLARPGGWIARITGNSFMKREFGRPLIERFMPTIDLQWIIDTSGAYIPGHGTPTVILVSRNQPPQGATVKTVMGVRGEPSVPDDPSRGLVWTAIENAVRPVETARRISIDMEREAEQCGPLLEEYSPSQTVSAATAATHQAEQLDLFGAAA